MRLSPRYPAWYLWELGYAYRLAGRYKDAIATQQEVLVRNPDYLFAYTELVLNYIWVWVFQFDRDLQILEQALEKAQRAVALNDALPFAHASLGFVYLWKQQYEQALASGARAIALAEQSSAPSDSTYAASYSIMALILSHVGQPEKALEMAETAMRLDSPFYADLYASSLGTAYYLTGRHEEAIAALKRSAMHYPAYLWAYAYLAAVYSELGREEEARAAVSEMLRISPHYSLSMTRQRWPFKDPAQLERFLTALRKAGLK